MASPKQFNRTAAAARPLTLISLKLSAAAWACFFFLLFLRYYIYNTSHGDREIFARAGDFSMLCHLKIFAFNEIVEQREHFISVVKVALYIYYRQRDTLARYVPIYITVL